eukprot:CAMPEP_0118829320 /NCGR_PEP_ID=MMETSP1162-20130426/23023_1 /TAXON_ID=33656 /ORGANISM="Phaeocystis Sp, Strain CCMP2710" /LENGTH=129 /DNA_ID=CAMNT_0006760479 /DNA_START=15 /DNA_END=401 /DNA_ORIENTATION=-
MAHVMALSAQADPSGGVSAAPCARSLNCADFMARHLCQAEILSFSTSENRNHLALGYLVKNLYGLVEWKMLSASLASSFHLEFGRLVPLLDASPPMPRVGFALRCARAWERAQRSTSTLSGVGELVARR